MTVQKRIWFVFFLLFILFSIGLALSLRMERTYLLNIQRSEIKEKKFIFEKILKLNQQGIFVLANDYSYWDELVMAIKKEDREWAKINIDSGIKTYGADGAWVYNMDFKLVYSVNKNADEKLKTLPLDKAQVEKFFAKEPLAHFIISTPAGFLELQGATVHPSNDSERKTPSEGYIFVGKLWDAGYLQTLSQLTNCTIALAPLQSLKNAPPTQDHFFIEVDDWHKDPLFAIVGEVSSEGIHRFQSHARVFLKLFLLYTALQMLFLLYFLRRFFKEPRKKT